MSDQIAQTIKRFNHIEKFNKSFYQIQKNKKTIMQNDSSIRRNISLTGLRKQNRTSINAKNDSINLKQMQLNKQYTIDQYQKINRLIHLSQSGKQKQPLLDSNRGNTRKCEQKVYKYYSTKLSRYLNASGDNQEYFKQTFIEHMVQSFHQLHYVNNLPEVKPESLKKKKVYLQSREIEQKTLIMDLDETLVHCSFDFKLSECQYKVKTQR